MRLVTRSILCLAAASLLAVSVAAAATRPLSQPIPVGDPAAIGSVRIGPASTQATCTVGVTDAPAYIIDYLYPPNDAYYTLIDPATCTACNTGAVTLTTAHVYLNFRAACSVPVSVGVYAATGDAMCWAPDPLTPLCTPFTVNLAPAAAGNYNFSIALPGGCCINGPAFLKVEFLSFPAACNASTNWPRLITGADCSAACTSWNIWPGGGPDDLCVAIGFPGYPVMNVDADCCDPTPAHRPSWGTLKSHYR